MSRSRFSALIALLVVVVACASFAVVLSLVGDDSVEDVQTVSTTTTLPTSTSSAADGLTTPVFVAIVSSARDEGAARATADELTERGYDSGVLRSDDHESLEAGFWVAYVGPFDEPTAAQAAAADLVADGYGAYARCVGTAEECG